MRMADLGSFGNTAKGLARNPLGIIALFIVLIYGFAALTLGINSLQASERLPLVWFLVLFPVLVLLTFGWLVSNHYEKLYSPDDYKSDESFLRGLHTRSKHTAELQAQHLDLKTKVRDVVAASSSPSFEKVMDMRGLLDKITEEIDQATTLTIDAKDFLNEKSAQYIFPVAAFETLSDLTDDVYFKLRSKVRPFEYGHTWVLRNQSTGEIIRNARMITGSRAGMPVPDLRTLADVGITPGSVLKVESPPNGK